MANEEYDPYGLAEGTTLGQGRVTITTASFGYDAQYKNGEQELAILEGTVVAEDGETYDWRKLYSLGAGWEVVDTGTRVQRRDGKRKNFQKQSKYGQWIAGALEAGAADTLRKRGAPMEARIWENLIFDVEARSMDYGGEIGKKDTLIPVKFHGEKDGDSAASASQSSAPSPASEPAPASGTVSGALKAKLRKLAQECDTHDAFIDKAFLVDGVDGNPAAESLVADSPVFYNELRA